MLLSENFAQPGLMVGAKQFSAGGADELTLQGVSYTLSPINAQAQRLPTLTPLCYLSQPPGLNPTKLLLLY